MPELVRQIELSNRFKKKPVGPLGKYFNLPSRSTNSSRFAHFLKTVHSVCHSNLFPYFAGSYVKVTDPKWALAVESVIKGRMDTFVVDNLDDEKILQAMIKRICTRGRRPGTIRTTFPTTVTYLNLFTRKTYWSSISIIFTVLTIHILQMYDTSRRAARSSEYGSVLDVVEVSNTVAYNMLIELCNLESTMLIPTDDECYRLLSSVQNVPRNCTKAFTLKADSYFPAPYYRTYSANQRSVTFLQSSRDTIIR